MNQPEQDPKIIVDDDWKDQAQREKEQLQRERDRSGGPQGATDELPPASLPMLVSMLSTQTMAALGFLSDPNGGPTEVSLGLAKHFIDTLAVLEEKTAGNLDADEAELLRSTLHQLRMAFVQVKQDLAQTPPPKESGPTIELP